MPPNPNWRNCVLKLEQKGLSQTEIGKLIDVSPSTVNRLKNSPDYNPQWNTGEALIMCVGKICAD